MLKPSEQNEAEPPADGVDVTLIHWLLELTPAERLEVLQSNMRSLEALRGAAAHR